MNLSQFQRYQQLCKDPEGAEFNDSRTFDTAAEANAFLAGIEHVNDSAISAWISTEDPLTVRIWDEDKAENEEEE